MINVIPGAKVWFVNDPRLIVELTGNKYTTGDGTEYVEIRLPDGGTERKMLSLAREGSNQPTSIVDCFDQVSFGRDRDLRFLLILQKIKGDLSDHLYSMQVGNLDFLPHQFRPVIKFLKSPTERLLIADEVGLGKTIEAVLIWLELQARRRARRLLVVCPNMLVSKWRDELRLKFNISAGVASAKDLVDEYKEFQRKGHAHSFVKIATYSSLRPTRDEWKKLTIDKETPRSDRGRLFCLLQGLNSDDENDIPFFDLVIMDEAHYLRNPESMVSKFGECLSTCTRSLVLLSATPVSNSNGDLLTLLRLLDPDFFKNEAFFKNMLEENKPALAAFSALMSAPPQYEKAYEEVVRLKNSHFIGSSTLLNSVLTQLDNKPGSLPPSDQSTLIDSVEQLNVLGNYYSRTRRAHVESRRPQRNVEILAVTLSKEEMAFYQLVTQRVQAALRSRGPSKSVFFLIQPQLRMSSSIPAMVEAYRQGDFGSWEELEESGLESDDNEAFNQIIREMDWSWLHQHNFTNLDSKFSVLKKILSETKGTKKIIFSFYRGTLDYLAQQIARAKIGFEVIHGGIDLDERLQAIERFKERADIDVLLTSEVGSEGLDLQFCHVLVNYDLPWNPMRIEQRIGRIDRIGQKADRLTIYNFKIRGTIEERLYDVLLSKVDIFENSLGSLEAVIGSIVEEWRLERFQSELTLEEEEKRQSQNITSARYVELLKNQVEQANFIGLSQMVDRQINDTAKMNRYVAATDLKQFIYDFFAGFFVGTVLRWMEHDKNSFELNLTFEARDSLDSFTHSQQLPSVILRGSTFKGQLIEDQKPTNSKVREYCAVNHFHPLIKWMVNEFSSGTHGMIHPSASLILEDDLNGQVAAGVFFYSVRLWTMDGFKRDKKLAFAVFNLNDGSLLPPILSELLIMRAASNGRYWPGQYVKDTVSRDMLQFAEYTLSNRLIEEYHTAIRHFELQNDNILSIKRAQIEGRLANRMSTLNKTIETLKERGFVDMIRPIESQITNAEQARLISLNKLEKQAQIKHTDRMVGFGLIKVEV